eukprot:CAMPEP_0170757866 /NCGR_PEP_ID=MMETSP0437-20130122/14745_1 /TAXON_ID=0 /ORGANISM="Sexangularia sp." /LENGTH=190 /DNA_ID=CAMNT_0011097061 /DNA_START=147 /DNA_END=716 /DNA_ORIENTATION=-
MCDRLTVEGYIPDSRVVRALETILICTCAGDLGTPSTDTSDPCVDFVVATARCGGMPTAAVAGALSLMLGASSVGTAPVRAVDQLTLVHESQTTTTDPPVDLKPDDVSDATCSFLTSALADVYLVTGRDALDDALPNALSVVKGINGVPVYPTAALYAGLALRSLGFPNDMVPLLLAIGRVPVWLAHFRD